MVYVVEQRLGLVACKTKFIKKDNQLNVGGLSQRQVSGFSLSKMTLKASVESNVRLERPVCEVPKFKAVMLV